MEIDEWREAAEPGLALHLHRLVLRRFIATFDALAAENAALREARDRVLALCDEWAYMIDLTVDPEGERPFIDEIRAAFQASKEEKP